MGDKSNKRCKKPIPKTLLAVALSTPIANAVYMAIIVTYSIINDLFDQSKYFKILLVTSVIAMAISLLLASLFIPAFRRKEHKLVLPWVVVQLVTLVLVSVFVVKILLSEDERLNDSAEFGLLGYHIAYTILMLIGFVV